MKVSIQVYLLSMLVISVINNTQTSGAVNYTYRLNMKVSSMPAISDKQYSDKKGLRRHIQAEHEGAEYTCNQCNYKATHYGKMKYHIQSVHEGVRYPCNLCNFQSTTFSSLKVHNQMKHEEVKYPCSHCDYKATHKSSLKRHNQSMHEANIECPECRMSFSIESQMEAHFLKVHDHE